MALTEFLTTDRALASVFNDKVVTPVNAYITANDAEVSKLKKFQNAGGTGTAITLTGVELTDGFNLTFIATANNSAAATTINTKPLYKPGTTTAPKLIAGKAATVWYNAAGDCFFIKASAEGDATAANVLAGKTFSNDYDTGLTGTMVNRGAVTITPGASQQAIPEGYHNGNGYVAPSKYASGSFTATASSHTVSNLTFKPDVVIVKAAIGSVWQIWILYSTGRTPYGYGQELYGAYAGYQLSSPSMWGGGILKDSNIAINSNGFIFNTDSGSTYEWIAIGH